MFDDLENFKRVYEAAIKTTSESKISSDALQNEALLILHHVQDAEKAVKEKNLDYISKSLADIKESANRMAKFLPSDMKKEINRATSED